MKIQSLALMAAMLGTNAWAMQAVDNKSRLIVYVSGMGEIAPGILPNAESIASGFFKAVGLTIEWRHRLPADSLVKLEKAVVVQLTTNTPAKYCPSALAISFPFEGIHARVLYDRMAWAEKRRGLAPVLLAHVLAHEIAHLVEGTDYHSGFGIMKARWEEIDYNRMMARQFSFGAFDAQLIFMALEGRH